MLYTPVLTYTILIFNCLLGGGNCPDSGDARSHKVQNLNILKNRHTPPTSNDIVNSVTIDSLLNSKDNPTAFDESKAISIEGYIIKAKEEKSESCNCHSKDPNDWDYHLYFAPTSYQKKISETVVIEITPYSRKLHPEYTFQYIQSIIGKKVKITGWLMYDFEHTNVSQQFNPEAKKIYRKTVWEIHPITSIQLMD